MLGAARQGTARVLVGRMVATGVRLPSVHARPGAAWLGVAGRGKAWRGIDGERMAYIGVRVPDAHARLGLAGRGKARRGEAWLGRGYR